MIRLQAAIGFSSLTTTVRYSPRSLCTGTFSGQTSGPVHPGYDYKRPALTVGTPDYQRFLNCTTDSVMASGFVDERLMKLDVKQGT